MLEILIITVVALLAVANIVLFGSLAISMFREGRELKNSIKRMDAFNHSHSL